MNTPKILFATLVAWMICGTALAQDKPFTHEMMDGWQRLANETLSRNGEWILADVRPQKGDGELVLRQASGSQEQHFARGANGLFTADSRYAVFLVKPLHEDVRQAKREKKKSKDMPKDSLVVWDIEGKAVHLAVARVKEVQVPEKWEGWVAYLLEKPLPEEAPKEADSTTAGEGEDGMNHVMALQADDKKKGNTLVLHRLADGQEWRYDRVEDFVFSELGSQLYFEQAKGDSAEPAAVWRFDATNAAAQLLDSAHFSYDNLTPAKSGLKLAFLASADSLDEDHRTHSLFVWETTAGLVRAVDTLTAGIPAQHEVSATEYLSWSDSGERLLFHTEPRPVKYAYEEDTTLLDDEKPRLDIWSWNDADLQPMQKERPGWLPHSHARLGMYHASQGKVVMLQEGAFEEVEFNETVDGPYAIVADSEKGRISFNWLGYVLFDVYVVDVSTGERRLLRKATESSPSISPEGTYAYWFSPSDSLWHSQPLAGGQAISLTAGLAVNFYDEEHDMPMMPGSYGMVGWLEGDERLLVRDRYDIWSLDPTGTSAPENITGGYGRENKVRLRWVADPNDEEEAISKNDPFIIVGQHDFEKWHGVYNLNLKRRRNRTVQELYTAEARVYGVGFAAENNKRLFYRECAYDRTPNVYTATLAMENRTQLTNANPDEGEYAWGSVELVNFISAEGKPLQGMLWKPANFDPTKKYPMVVDFYEKSSDGLHRHIAPQPTWSVVNHALYVSNGYVVFTPDIVYEDGYPGRSAYNCIIPGVLKVMGMGFVDEKRIGIQGQSWGGYQVAYLVTRTNMFASAMAGAPVGNMTSAYGGIRWGSGMSRMFQYEHTQSRIGGTIWNKRDLYIENSPVFFADRIETPLLMMHNDADGAVPWYQGIEMYMAMRRNKQPAWLLVYNGEAHNLRKRPNRRDLSIRMLQFFDHYLKEAPAPVWMTNGLPYELKGRTLRYELNEK